MKIPLLHIAQEGDRLAGYRGLILVRGDGRTLAVFLSFWLRWPGRSEFSADNGRYTFTDARVLVAYVGLWLRPSLAPVRGWFFEPLSLWWGGRKR